MSFPRYPKYKPSGVEWLGEVPAHWVIKPFGYLCDKIGSGKTPSGGAEIYTDAGIVFLRSQNVYDEGLFLDDVVFITPEIDEELRSSRVQAGDILLNITGASLGRTCLVPPGLPKANVNQHVCILRTNDLSQREYVSHSMKSRWVRAQIDVAQSGAAREGLNFAQIAKLSMTIPPLAEQTRIAEFLDRETAKIDELVAEQRRLMELLKEKRQAVISHAVTRGLNPQAPLKPTGIEWLGDVPSHWTVASVRRMVRRIEQGWSPDCFGRPAESGEWGVVKSGCVNRGVFVEEENKALPETLDPIPEYEIRAGDVLMSRASGSPELVGSTAYITATRPKLMLSDKIFRVHPEPIIDREFFVAVFNSRVMRSQIERAISGAEGLANNLPQSALKGFFCVVPPLPEQTTIVSYLKSELAKFDTLTAEAQRAIDLLQERRTALISAAVTGQIDVRGAVT